MIASTAATIATLLFLAFQNKQLQKVNEYQREVTQAQLAAMNFEQYINHRRLFMDRLGELQTTFENKFVFVDGEALYNRIFTKNGPTNLEFKVLPINDPSGENLLGRLGARLTRLDVFLNQSQWDREGTRKLVGLLIDIYTDLQIRWDSESFDGDIVFFKTNTGINIYSLDEFLRVAKSIYNSLLFYTGNPLFTGFEKGMMRYPREALMEFFLDNAKLRESLDVVKNIPGLAIMERLFFRIDTLRDDSGSWVMPETYSALLKVFGSRKDVTKLREDAFVDEIVSLGCHECFDAMQRVGSEKDDYSTLQQCGNDLNLLISRNG